MQVAMELILDVELFDEIDEVELVEYGVPRALFNRANHYHNMPDYTFFKRFRLRKETVMFLLPLIEDELEFASDINHCVSPINQLLTCLRYFATGGHLDSVADFMGMHQTTAIRITHRVARAIAALYNRFIKMPLTPHEQQKIKAEFFEVAHFPNVIGAIDCTHIKIRSPGGMDAELFRNRKDYFSINVQAICDANNKFLNVVARWPGASHDSTIFNQSAVKTLFEDGHVPNCILLGDRGYHLTNYLLTPLANPDTPAEHLYNQSHIRTRNKIECSFGILKRRFPVLAYGCRLQINSVLTVIIAAAVLHNIAKVHNEPEPQLEENIDAGALEQLIADGQIHDHGVQHNIAGNGYNFRSQLIQEYFARL